jgi:hypothetical protein
MLESSCLGGRSVYLFSFCDLIFIFSPWDADEPLTGKPYIYYLRRICTNCLAVEVAHAFRRASYAFSAMADKMDGKVAGQVGDGRVTGKSKATAKISLAESEYLALIHSNLSSWLNLMPPALSPPVVQSKAQAPDDGDNNDSPVDRKVEALATSRGPGTYREATLADHMQYVKHYQNKSLEPGVAPGTVKVIEGEDDISTYPALMADTVPNNLRWYVVTVGVTPGVYQGW